jgi:hypothetical protein
LRAAREDERKKGVGARAEYRHSPRKNGGYGGVVEFCPTTNKK